MKRIRYRSVLLLLAALFAITARGSADYDFTYTVSDGEATVTGLRYSSVTELIVPLFVMDDKEGMVYITSISAKAFSGRNQLRTVIFLAPITSIGNSAFSDCTSLTSIALPESLTSMGSDVFTGCTSLTDIYCYATAVPAGGKGLLSSAQYALCTLHVPASLIDSYKSNQYWKDFTNIAAIEEEGDEFTVAEYFIGNDPGLGQANIELLFPDDNGSCEFEIPAEMLNYGMNVVGIRLLTERDGQQTFSPTDIRHIYRYHAPTSATSAIEYFVGRDPGVGKATRIPIEADEKGSVSIDIPDYVLRYGLNTLGLRLISTNINDEGATVNSYSPTILRQVYRYHAQDAHTVGIEYFLNSDPGVGKAKRVNATGDEVSFDIDRSEMREGINILGLRIISQNSETGITYSPTRYQYVYRRAADGIRDIERIEYFWDTDPGKGNGKAIVFVKDGENAIIDGATIDYRGLYGTHILNVRALSHGVWSTLYQQAVILPAGILSGDLTLDPSVEEDTDEGLFSQLATLLGALSTRGFSIGLNVNVTDAVYNVNITDDMVAVVQGLYSILVEKNFYISMKAQKSATFNFFMPEEFIYAHQQELPQIVAAVQALFSHIVTENISVLINGQTYKYDGFQVDPNDMMALHNLYNRLNGENWTQKKWTFLSNGRDKSEMPGVTFSDAGRVRGIDLKNNNLQGQIGSWELMLPELLTLDLSRNRLTGDVGPFASELTKLQSLDMSYNRLTEVSVPLPKTIGTLNLQSQYRIEDDEYGVYNVDEPFDDAVYKLWPVRVYVSKKQTVKMPTLFTYNHKNQDYSSSYGIRLFSDGKRVDAAWVQRSSDTYAFNYTSNYDYAYQQDALWVMAPMYGDAAHSAYPIATRFFMGDADMSGVTDVLDVQHTLNYILATATPFNYSAANTYSDQTINVQDIVCTVNIVLEPKTSSTTISTGTVGVPEDTSVEATITVPTTEPSGEVVIDHFSRITSFDNPSTWLFTRNGQLLIASTEEVGAIGIELSGVTTSQVSLLLNHSRFQLMGRDTDNGSRFVIFSPTGDPIPAGETLSLLKLSADAKIVSAQVSDMNADDLHVALNQQPTGIALVGNSRLSAKLTDDGLVITTTAEVSDVTLRLTTAGGAVVFSTSIDRMARGENHVAAGHLPKGVYILEMTTADGNSKTQKLMNR